MNIYNALLVGTGGFIGSVARYLVGYGINKKYHSFPYATLCINVIGSFVLGLLIGFLLKKGDSDTWRLFLGTGFCGGFTTFSTFAFENVNLIEEKMYGAALLYVLASLVLAVIAASVGLVLGKSA